MGILDIPALASTTAKKVVGSAAGHFAACRHKLDRDLSNVHIAVYGDSTGKGTGIVGAGTDARWPYLFAQRLAAAYPTKTVIFHDWDVTTNAYLTPNVTVQTGTGTGNGGGPYTIDIWNGSAVGQAPSYSRTWMFSMTPAIVPDLIFINHGHNLSDTVDTGTSTAAFYALGTDVLRWFNPNAPVVFMTQNPQTAPRTAAQINGQARRAVRILELCANEGWGVINVMRAFLDQPSLTGLVKPDGVHPEAPAGNQLWIDTIWQVWQQAPYATPAAAARIERLWLPAHTFEPTAGAVGGVLNSFLPVMSFLDTGVAVSAATTVHIPSAWRRVNVWIYWTTTDGVAGNVVWNQQFAYIARINQEVSSATNTAPLALGGANVLIAAAPTVALAESHSLISPLSQAGLVETAPNPPRTVVIQITRASGNASDTYGGTAHMYGVLIERAA